MRNIIIDNECSSEESMKMVHILTTRFREGREYWFDFNLALSPINIQGTLDKFSTLECGDNLIFSSYFKETRLFEIFVAMLFKQYRKKVRLNIYFLEPDLQRKLDKYLLQDQNEDSCLRFLTVVNYHNFYCMAFGREDQLVGKPEPVHSILTASEAGLSVTFNA